MLGASSPWGRALDFSLPPKLMRQFAAFGRVVHALILREARTRFGKQRLGYLWALAEPAMYLLGLWAFYELLGRRIPVHASMAAFLLTGIFPFMAFRSSSVRGATAVKSNLPLLVHPMVQPFSIVTSRVLLEFVTYMVVALLFILVLWIYFDEPLSSWTDEPLNLLFALSALMSLTFGFAVFNASVAQIVGWWPEVIKAFGRVLFFTSGVFYTMDTLPPQAREAILLNPMSHVIEWIRSAALPGFESLHYNAIYPFAWAAWLLFCGLFMDWLLRLTGHTEAP